VTVITVAGADLLGAAMVDFTAGRSGPLWLRVASGSRVEHEVAAYFAPVAAEEQALLHLAAPAGWRLEHSVRASSRYWAAFILDPTLCVRQPENLPGGAAAATSGL
jgi:hypothetical protein